MTGANGDSVEDEGINLTDNEARALALYLVAQWARHDDRPEWEDLPYLGEHAFERLCDAIVAVGHEVEQMADAYLMSHNIDAAYLLTRAQDNGSSVSSSTRDDE